jgi:3-dehydroquinate synthase
MNFSINGKEFNEKINFENTLTIKSFNKDYQVIYNNETLNEIVWNNYNQNDFIFIDRNVYNLDEKTFEKIIDNVYIFDACEDNKTIENVLKLVDILLEKKITKKNKVIIIGGGITQEIGGFCCGIFKRGINWIFVPTTVLSMTDSSIGSKISINRNSKNMLGMFTSPNKIIISDYFLNSLSQNDILSGVGESLKLCLIGGQTTYKLFLDNYNEKNYINLIKLASMVKKIIIEYDEFEKQERKVLNYGHTIGHAIESTTNYFIPHGIAILIGMYVKNVLFYENKYQEINNLILSMIDTKYFQTHFPYKIFIDHILNDKKNDGDNICFILLNDIGSTVIVYKKLPEFEKKMMNILKTLFINFV